jgi:glycopeptide antibiotics resistance protein
MGIECGIVVLLGFLISLTIELVQHYVVFRIFDIDDIILNTVGTAVGYFFFLVARHILVRNVNIGGEHHEGNQ